MCLEWGKARSGKKTSSWNYGGRRGAIFSAKGNGWISGWNQQRRCQKIDEGSWMTDNRRHRPRLRNNRSLTFRWASQCQYWRRGSRKLNWECYRCAPYAGQYGTEVDLEENKDICRERLESKYGRFGEEIWGLYRLTYMYAIAYLYCVLL